MLIGLAAIVALFTALWLASLALKNASIVDMWWGPGILLVGLTYYVAFDSPATRRPLTLALVALWAVRLAWHIGARNVGHGEDFRYAAWRQKYGSIWWIRSYVHVFLLQAVIAWIVAMPLYFAITSAVPPRLTWWDQAGCIVFAFGFAFEALGDEQLRRFRANAANKGRVLNTGLWRYTRRPNYFGEAVLWWGFGLIGAATPGGFVGLLGPAAITFLLIKVSGVAMLEATLKHSKPGYAAYIDNTPSFFPLPPKARS